MHFTVRRTSLVLSAKLSLAVLSLAVLSLAVLSLVSVPTHAATPPAQPAAGDALEEITVTARRRAESLHDTPVAVTALPVSQLEDREA
jgi:iron complex outermembrane recepter protein